MIRSFPILVCFVAILGCTPENQPPRPIDKTVVYVRDTTSGEEVVSTEFVILDETGQPLDERNGNMLRRRAKPEQVAEQEIVNGEGLAATNNLKMKFKQHASALKPVAGRPVTRKKPKPKAVTSPAPAVSK